MHEKEELFLYISICGDSLGRLRSGINYCRRQNAFEQSARTIITHLFCLNGTHF